MAGRAALRTEHLELTAPRLADSRHFLDLVATSRSLHAGVVEPPASRQSYAAYVKRAEGRSHAAFLVWAGPDSRLIGVVNLNNIARGSLQSASLGYYRLAAGGGRGAIQSAVALVIEHAFVTLGLHRLEANIQPSNERSRALVRSLGFRIEGLAASYLRIGGEWQDHERWALLRDEWKE